MRKMPPTGVTADKLPSRTSEDRAKPEWVIRIEREHAVLRTLLRALEARLASDRPCPEWAQSVGETLGALVPMLQEHFSREEHELSPSRIEATFPGLASRIHELNAEHFELLTAFSRARQDCMERESDESLPEDLRADLAAAISDLRRHEVAETELLAVGRWFDLPERR